MFSFSHITFLSAEFRMPDGFPRPIPQEAFVHKQQKGYTKITKKRVVNLRIFNGKTILKVSSHLKNLNIPLKTLNKKLGKEKIKTYLCTRYKK